MVSVFKRRIPEYLSWKIYLKIIIDMLLWCLKCVISRNFVQLVVTFFGIVTDSTLPHLFTFSENRTIFPRSFFHSVFLQRSFPFCSISIRWKIKLKIKRINSKRQENKIGEVHIGHLRSAAGCIKRCKPSCPVSRFSSCIRHNIYDRFNHDAYRAFPIFNQLRASDD